VKAKLDAAQKRFDERRAIIMERVDAFERESEAKIKALQEQAEKATGEMKAKLDARIAEERTKHDARVNKLGQAWQLVKEAGAI
jgi:LPS O-antigen subunit length determinant protein (WzzB/FepE family)